jgi:hypothetical protein
LSTIHQMYCTHCTHGSSALERRQGELADRMLGYSARAGSLEAADLRRCYRQVERYLYYYLPRDAPVEDKLRLVASTAPRRLVYLPSTGGLQMVAQVCYRQTDTQGRPGSYFAHILFQPERSGQPPWSSLDCVKLWGAAGWVEEDSPQIPFLLLPLSSLTEMLRQRRPAIDDAVMASFLRSPPGGPFDDPAGIIPFRWRQKPVAQRVGLLRDVLSGYLETAGGQRQSVLLVVEPAVAALVFYGVLRLLPEGTFRDGVSLSTFEPNTERLCTTLAATHFADPQRSDLRPETYRSGGFVVNTFSERRSESRSGDSSYADFMLGHLLEKGFREVDLAMARMVAAGARRIEDLRQLAAAERAVPMMLQSGEAPADHGWRSSPAATAYLRQALGQTVAGLGDPQARLGTVIGRPAHLLLIELLAGAPELPGTAATVDFLIRSVPGEQIGDLLRLEPISAQRKIDVLVRYVSAHADLPRGCETLWHEDAQPPHSRSRSADEALLPQVFARLDPKTLEAWSRSAGERNGHQFVRVLAQSCRQRPANRALLTGIVEPMPDEALAGLLASLGPAFLKDYPADEPALGGRLHALLLGLTDHLGQFQTRLDVILAGRHLLPDELDRRTASAWGRCCQAIVEIGGLQGQNSGMFRRPPVEKLEEQCQAMSEAAVAAMSPDIFKDDARGTGKLEILRKIGPRLLDGKKLLPPGNWLHQALWQKVLWYFETGTWSTAPLKRMRPSRPLAGLTWGLVFAGTAALAVGLFFAVRGLSPSGPPDDDEMQIVVERGPAPRRAPPRTTPGSKAETPDPADVASSDDPAAKTPRVDPAAKDDAATKAADEARMKADQEAARRAAEEKAAAEKAEAAKMAAAERERQWREHALRFAELNNGRYLEALPLNKGNALIPSSEWKPLPLPAELLLGGGRLEFGEEVYRFGEDFAKVPPAKRQEVPGLAEKLGFRSVYVEIQSQPSGPVLAVRGEWAPAASGLSAQERERVDQLTSRAQMIRAQLVIYHRSTTTEDKKNEAYNAVVRLLGLKIPEVIPEPDRHDAKYRDHPEIYQKDLQAHNQSIAARDKVKESVIPAATQGAAAMDQKVKEIEAGLRDRRADARRAGEEAQADLRLRSQRISAVVYQLSGHGDGTTKPAPQAAPAAAEAGELVIDGQFKVDPAAAAKLDATTTMARVRPMVGESPGKRLPEWVGDRYRVGCLIEEYDAQGNVRLIRLDQVDGQSTLDLFKGTAKAAIRFSFTVRGDALAPGSDREVAHSPWHPIDPIEADRQYTVKLELTAEHLKSLQRLANR